MNFNCWTALVAVVVFVVVSHDTSKVQAADSSSMQRFKKTLNVEETNLLKRHLSKSSYIERLFARNKGVDKRDEIPATGETHEETGCCNCNLNSKGCFDPSDVKRSRIIRCCIPEPAAAAAKRDQVSTQEVMDAESPADQELMEKHQSKMKYLVAAAQHPEGADDSSKRSLVEGERDITKRLMTDINLAKKYGIKLDDLLASIKRRSMSANKKGKQ